MNAASHLDELASLRRNGLACIAACGWAATFAILMLIPAYGAAAVASSLASIAVNILPSRCAWKGRLDRSARYSVAIMAAAQPAFVVYAMAGSPWQLDGHMYFFVALAMLTILCDVRPIILAAVLISLHHLALAFVVPEWVFSGGGGLRRVLVHILAIVLEAGALCFIGQNILRLFGRLEHTLEDCARLAIEAREAQRRAEAALEEAEEERLGRIESEREQQELRRFELVQIAENFENSVASIAAAVSDSARTLDEAAGALDDVAHATGSQAVEVATAARQASTAARSVAINVSNLTRSIDSVVDNATRQSGLSGDAEERTTTGGSALTALSRRSRSIELSIRTIADIARKTNILALNATIEAAAAGGNGASFKVVANEVKELAGQVATVTDQVSALLTEMRDGTSEAEESFDQIASAINELTRASQSIQEDAEKQRHSAHRIEASAGQTAEGVDEMASRLSTLVAKAESTGTLSSSVRSSASSLLDQSIALKRATTQFVEHLRAA